ncbi:MAG TPA: bifunctional oligoribonuclease/PAP phosphatase NrnA [Actinomycetota bacterium]|nr:bifunctional oligoribonuclease/PAP phosphatase NrnA [Actinomycetota bacterium]
MANVVAQFEDIASALRDASSIAIACHVNPDGDALGSALGASLALRKAGKQTAVSWDDPVVKIPASYAFLPGGDHVVAPDQMPSADVFLALDCGGLDRLGSLEVTATASPCLVNIDHHPGNTDFGKLNAVITSASSTAELVAQLIGVLGIELDRDIATCLYTGIVTDTGRFQYVNSTPDTLRLAADLLAYDVPASEIAVEVFESAPFGYLKLVGRLLERATLDSDQRLVYSWITRADLTESKVAKDETDKLIDFLRSIRDAEIAAIFKEQEDGRFRVSMRSKGPRSVGAIARANGGGGHELAAGFSADTIDAAIAAITTGLQQPE